MKILIVEDEHYAAKRLEGLLKKELPEADILAVLDTVQDSVEWLSSHVSPSLIFMDIQLADGLSFQIFEKVKVPAPIIFVTAYDEYALSAFKVNSIDYLLKPIEEEALKASIKKYQEFFPSIHQNEFDWASITKEIFQPGNQYKQRFLVKSGNAYTYLNSEDIALIYSEEGISFALTADRRRSILDFSIDKLTSELDPKKFFRISRKHLVSIDAIKKMHPYLNNRLKLELNTENPEDLIVSRKRVKYFKAWVDS